MKRLITTLLFIAVMGSSVQAQSPNFKEWFRQKKTQRQYLVQQIAALNVYLEYLKKGYKIVDKGLTLIGDIKDGTFSLDKDYFNSLRAVSPVIRNSPSVTIIAASHYSIVRSFQKLLKHCTGNDNYTAEELAYVRAVNDEMIADCNAAIAELELVISSGTTEMKDDERLKRLDKICGDFQDKYAFTKSFCNSTILLGLQREKEKTAIKTISDLTTD